MSDLTAALAGVLARLDEHALPDRLEQVRGRMSFRLGVPRRVEET